MSKQVQFEQALEPTDFGFIVCSKTGRLKGLWIPEGMEEEMVPESISNICKEFFGVDPNQDNNSTLLH